MRKKSFIETIKVKDGELYNFPMHLHRLQNTAHVFYQTSLALELSEGYIPDDMRSGLVKCRIVYSDEIESIQFEPYVFKTIKTLAVIYNDTIDYTYKSVDRSSLDQLLSSKGDCDDILIVKNNLITDTSYSNVVFRHRLSGELQTPSNPLLKGIKRQSLLEKGVISERVIRIDDLPEYDELFLINAMIDLEDKVSIPVTALVL